MEGGGEKKMGKEKDEGENVTSIDGEGEEIEERRMYVRVG